MKHTWYALCVLRMLMLYSMYVSVVQLLCHQHDLDSYNYHTVWCYCILGIMEVWAFFLTLSPKKKTQKKKPASCQYWLGIAKPIVSSEQP